MSEGKTETDMSAADSAQDPSSTHGSTDLSVPQGRPSTRRWALRMVLVTTVLSMSLAAAVLYVYDTKYAQKLVVLDMGSFMEEQRALLLEGKVAESDQRFDQLDGYLNALPANHVVLLKSVAIRNAPEIKP